LNVSSGMLMGLGKRSASIPHIQEGKDIHNQIHSIIVQSRSIFPPFSAISKYVSVFHLFVAIKNQYETIYDEP
jgi:hypothetical protein